MKRILCLIDSLGFGGAERQLISLVCLLKKGGYTVDLATYVNHNFDQHLKDTYGITCIKLKPKQSSRLSKILVVRKLVKSKRYDCVIAYKDGPAVIGCILKLTALKFKLLVSERNTTQILDLGTKIKFNLYRCADFVVPNSYAQAIFISRFFPFLKRKTKTITNFTDIDHFIPLQSDSHPQIRILTVARVTTQKNVKRYMNVAKRLVQKGYNVQFDWYGAAQVSEPGYREDCIKLLDVLGLRDYMSFHSPTSEIVSVFQQCDIFCLPSIYEGYPNVLCEAMSCGKPILCSNVCDNPLIVKENVNAFLFDPCDEDDMLKKIEQMILMDKSQRELMGLKSREIANKIFSKDAFVNKYIKLIED